MRFDQLLQLYFERSEALQWYWTLYVVIIGGLLAFSSLRHRPNLVMAALVTVLFACFAVKNLGAIHDATEQRLAILAGMDRSALSEYGGDHSGQAEVWQALRPTLNPPAYPGVRNFHIACDVLTLAAVWAMEGRRNRTNRQRRRIKRPRVG